MARVNRLEVLGCILATRVILRETELAGLTLDNNGSKIDEYNKVISLHLPVQKNDPGAKGAWRALPCRRMKEDAETCPFHVARSLVDLQLRRLGMKSQLDAQVQGLPLIGQMCDPCRVVEKENMIQHAQKFAALMKQKLNDASLFWKE